MDWEYPAWMKCWAVACPWDIHYSWLDRPVPEKPYWRREFLAAGARAGEPGVIAAFEKTPSQLVVPRPEVKHLATRVPSAAGCSTRILSPDRLAVQQKTLAHNGSRFKSLLKLWGLLANVALIYGPSLCSPWLVDRRMDYCYCSLRVS